MEPVTLGILIAIALLAVAAFVLSLLAFLEEPTSVSPSVSDPCQPIITVNTGVVSVPSLIMGDPPTLGTTALIPTMPAIPTIELEDVNPNITIQLANITPSSFEHEAQLQINNSFIFSNVDTAHQLAPQCKIFAIPNSTTWIAFVPDNSATDTPILYWLRSVDWGNTWESRNILTSVAVSADVIAFQVCPFMQKNGPGETVLKVIVTIFGSVNKYPMLLFQAVDFQVSDFESSIELKAAAEDVHGMCDVLVLPSDLIQVVYPKKGAGIRMFRMTTANVVGSEVVVRSSGNNDTDYLRILLIPTETLGVVYLVPPGTGTTRTMVALKSLDMTVQVPVFEAAVNVPLDVVASPAGADFGRNEVYITLFQNGRVQVLTSGASDSLSIYEMNPDLTTAQIPVPIGIPTAAPGIPLFPLVLQLSSRQLVFVFSMFNDLTGTNSIYFGISNTDGFIPADDFTELRSQNTAIKNVSYADMFVNSKDEVGVLALFVDKVTFTTGEITFAQIVGPGEGVAYTASTSTGCP